MKNRKAIGGPLDIMHTFVILGIVIILMRAALKGNSYSPRTIIILGIIMIVVEILGVLM